MIRLLPILLLAGCGPIPVQVQSSKQEQSQRQSNEQHSVIPPQTVPNGVSVPVRLQSDIYFIKE